MTLVLILRTRDGIAIAGDSLSTATETREIDGHKKTVNYYIYKRRKISPIRNFAVVHAGLSFLNGRSIHKIVESVKSNDPVERMSAPEFLKHIKKRFLEEILKDPILEHLEKDFLIISLGITGYYKGKPFIHKILYFKNTEEDPVDIMESEDTFKEPYYSIDYFGDFEFVQMVIRAAKKENLLKPFDILTMHEAMDLNRTLLRFLIEFQKYMVEKTVAYPIESAIIDQQRGFVWIDKFQLEKFHYDDHEDGI